MCYILKLKGMVPQTKQTYTYYVIGAVLSYLTIAIGSDWIYGKRKKFYPLYIWLLISIIYQVSLLIVSTFKVIPDNIWSEFVEGFIDNSTTFYFLFLAPIMIAYTHRAT